MSNVVNSNASQTIAQVFTSKSGPLYGGIIGIVMLVGMYYMMEGKYKIAASTEHGTFSFEPSSSGFQDISIDMNRDCFNESEEGTDNE